MKITYDKQGRMNYNPKFHRKHGTAWTLEDLTYLIEWHDIIGAEEMSFTLERTARSVSQKVVELRARGMMPQDARGYHERMKKDIKKE